MEIHPPSVLIRPLEPLGYLYLHDCEPRTAFVAALHLNPRVKSSSSTISCVCLDESRVFWSHRRLLHDILWVIYSLPRLCCISEK